MKYLFTFLLFASITLAAYTFPQPVGYVSDYANILTDKQLLENGLAAYEENTTIEIALVTLESVPPEYTLFSYGVELFDQWNIGKSDDNGILVLIVKNGTTGNRLRVELGYGIQGYITGAEAGRVLDNALPFYEEGDYQTAAEIILGELSDELVNYVPGQRNSPDWDLLLMVIFNFPFVIFAVIFIVSVAMRNRCPYCVRGKLRKQGDHYVCQRCGKKVTKKKRYAPFVAGGGFHGGGGASGGFGGFGGGASGGGGAGR